MLTTITIVAVLAVVAYAYSVKRGRLFVRSYLFLLHLSDGASVEEANKAANVFGSGILDPGEEVLRTRHAEEFVRIHFGGKQLPLIELAQHKGFRE